MEERSRWLRRGWVRGLGSPAAIAVVAALLATGSAATEVTAVAVQPITVDGSTADWAGVPTFYLDDGPRVTAIAHDDRFLYLQFRFSDPELARQLLTTGVIVWVNGEGKHRTAFGVRYRGSAAIEDEAMRIEGRDGRGHATPPGAEPPSGRPDFGREENQGSATPGEELDRPPLGALEVMRLGAVSEVLASGAQPDGLAAASTVADGAFSFEFRVPFEMIGEAKSPRGATSRREIAVGFQMVGITKAEAVAIRKNRGSTRGRTGVGRGEGGFGGPGGGGFRESGGGPRSDRPGASAVRPAKILWVDVTLADESPATSSRLFPDADEYWG